MLERTRIRVTAWRRSLRSLGRGLGLEVERGGIDEPLPFAARVLAPNDLRWVSGQDRSRRDVAVDHAIRRDDRPCAGRDATGYHRGVADPHALLDPDPAPELQPRFRTGPAGMRPA